MPTPLIPSEKGQQAQLEEAQKAVQVASRKMKANLTPPVNLMDALKDCSTMVSELRTGSLSPKLYADLYMDVFDSLQLMSAYLKNNHPEDQLADLYELVQYAANVVPRLYLMATVGSVYMGIKNAPVKEIMKDMMEMSRGIQHPVRGMFFRYYLVGQTQNLLPTGKGAGPEGNVQDSINFLYQNFVEMNKLWVRFQNQGHSLDTERRSLERDQLKNLIGSNLAKIGDLADLESYKQVLVPILEQVVYCRDVLAQEYLLEVITQVFPDDFHIATLDLLLSTIVKVKPKVNRTSIIIDLIKRLATYAQKDAVKMSAEEAQKQEELGIARLLSRLTVSATDTDDAAGSYGDSENHWEVGKKDEAQDKLDRLRETGETEQPSNGSEDTKDDQLDSSEQDQKPQNNASVAHLFETFSNLTSELKTLSISNVVAIFESLANFALATHPGQVEYVDKVFELGLKRINQNPNDPDLFSDAAQKRVLGLIMTPFNYYRSIFTALALPHLGPFLNAQPYQTRLEVATKISQRMISNRNKIQTEAHLNDVLSVMRILIEAPSTKATNQLPSQQHSLFSELVTQQGLLARIVHLIAAPTNETQFSLLSATRHAFEKGNSRVQYTTPALVTAFLRLARSFKAEENTKEGATDQLTSVFRVLLSLVSYLGKQVVRSEYLAFRLYDSIAQVADQLELHDLARGFFQAALDLYLRDEIGFDNGISSDLDKFNTLLFNINSLHGTRSLSTDDYITFSTKVSRACGQLHIRAVMLASHLWWPSDLKVYTTDNVQVIRVKEDEGAKMNSRQLPDWVLQCLQRALTVADKKNKLKPAPGPYVEILDRYLYYVDHETPGIAPFVDRLISVIRDTFKGVEAPEEEASAARRHFEQTLQYHHPTRTLE